MPGFAELALVQGMSFLATAQEASAHNLANATTNGFKRRVPISTQATPRFQSLLDANLPTARYSHEVSRESGEANPTGDKQHVSIFEPDRYFALRGDDGQVFYARTGIQRFDEQGRLVNEMGDVYLDQALQPIVIADGPASITITENGTILDDNGLVPTGAQIGRFADKDRVLQPGGGNRLIDPRPGNQPLPDANIVDAETDSVTRVRQGFLERSNVSATSEMVQMLTVQRSFQATSRALGALGRIHQAFVGAVTS